MTAGVKGKMRGSQGPAGSVLPGASNTDANKTEFLSSGAQSLTVTVSKSAYNATSGQRAPWQERRVRGQSEGARDPSAGPVSRDLGEREREAGWGSG